MTYSVSSGFISTAKQSTAPFKRKLTIAGSDYSDRVIRWPQFQNVSDRINIDNVSLNIANVDGVFSHFPAAPTLMESQVQVKLGFDYAVSSTEYITLFDGKVDSFRMVGGTIQINAANKFAQLSNRTIGSITTPTNYTGSNYTAHDLAWYLATSHGGLSALTSTSNPDIDYSAFNSWTAANSLAPTLFSATFNGVRAIDALERLARFSRSSVLIENGKLKFIQIPSTPGTAVDSFTYDNTINSDVLFDKRSMFNRYYVGFGYDVSSDKFADIAVAANSSSVNSFGARDSNLWDKTVWHATSASAQRLADFTVQSFGTPKARVLARTPLATAFVGIGDTVTFIDSNANIYGSFAVNRETIDMEGGTKQYQLDQVSANVTPITLDLAFAATKTLDPRITFTRASNATYYNASGTLTLATSGSARFDHNPTTLESLGLLVEEQRTNLLTYSDQFDNVAWTKDSITITANSVVAPDGATTADTLVSTITGGGNNAFVDHGVVSVSAGVTYTFSVFVKAGTSPKTTLNLYRSSPFSQVLGEITWASGSMAASGTDLLSSSFTAVGNGWYRASLTMNSGTATGMITRVYVRDQGSGNVTGETSIVWGAQLEAGEFSTSYIPTTASAATRNADIATMTGTNFSSWYNQTEGTFVANFLEETNRAIAGTSYRHILQAAEAASATNRVGMLVTQANVYNTEVAVSGVLQANIGSTSNTGTASKFALAYATNDFASAANGGTVATDTSGSVPSVLTTLYIGHNQGAAALGTLNGTIARLTYYPIRLSNSDLQALTT